MHASTTHGAAAVEAADARAHGVQASPRRRGRGIARALAAPLVIGASLAAGIADEAKARMSWPSPPPMTINADDVYLANMLTSKGRIVMRLDASQAPVTVNNFVFLARAGFYNGTRFHRVIPGFVIQGGDPTGTGRGGPGYTFGDELPESGAYRRGSVAMANSGPDTNGSQFFVVVGRQGVELPPNYTLFGQVISGARVVSAIASTPRRPSDAPLRPVIIRRVDIGVAP